MARELRERMVELAIADLRRTVDDGEVINFLEDITNEIYTDLEDEYYEGEDDYYENDYDCGYEESELDRLSEALEELQNTEDEYEEDSDDDTIDILQELFGPDVEIKVLDSREDSDEHQSEELDDLEQRLQKVRSKLEDKEEDLTFSLDMEEFSDDSVKEIARLIKSVLGE